jgi:type VI secretion system secreted protein VgrG
LEIEDKAGQQRITLSTPHANTYLRMGSPNADHELIVNTEKNALINTGANFDVFVGGEFHETVHGAVWINYEATKAETVAAAVSEQFGTTQDTVVTGLRSSTYGSLTRVVSGATNETYHAAHTTQSWAARTVEVGGSHAETSHSGRNTNVIGTWTQTATGTIVITAPEVEVKGTSNKSIFGPSLEFYTSKNEVGAQSSFATGMSFQVTGYLVEGGGVHGETYSVKDVSAGAAMHVIGSHIKTVAVAAARGGVSAATFGLVKLG